MRGQMQRLGLGFHKPWNTKDCLVTTSQRKKGKILPQRLRGEPAPANSWILDFWLPEVRKDKFLLFKDTLFVVNCQKWLQENSTRRKKLKFYFLFLPLPGFQDKKKFSGTSGPSGSPHMRRLTENQKVSDTQKQIQTNIKNLILRL